MNAIGQTIANSMPPGLGMTRRLLEGIDPASFARLAIQPSSTNPVTANHPAFVLGHLSIYPQQLVPLLVPDTTNLDVPDVTVPESWQALFHPSATCQDDPDASIYPHKDELINAFFTGYESLQTLFPTITDDTFNLELEDPKRRSFVKTTGGLAAFLSTGHLMFHAGQLSTWRRIVGLPPA